MYKLVELPKVNEDSVGGTDALESAMNLASKEGYEYVGVIPRSQDPAEPGLRLVFKQKEDGNDVPTLRRALTWLLEDVVNGMGTRESVKFANTVLNREKV